MPNPIAVNLVSGLLGSGKTTLIQQLLPQRPAHERWAILINEFGELGVDGLSLQSKDVDIYEVNGGCICCSAQANLTRSLQQIGQTPIDRLIIEPTGLGHPTRIIDALKRAKTPRPLQLRHHLVVIDATRFNDTLWHKSATLRDLVSLADSLILNKTDLISAESCAVQQQFFQQLSPPKNRIFATQQGRISINLLDEVVIKPTFLFLPAAPELHPLAPQTFNSRLPLVHQAWLQPGQPGSVSWLFDERVLFMRPALKRWFEQPPQGLIRAKGLIRSGREWQLINWVNGQLDWQDRAWREDSRLEMLFENEINLNKLEKSLDDTLQIRDLTANP